MTTSGERKCALLLLSLRASDRRALLARLPAASARKVKAALHELEAMHLTREIAEELLASEGLVDGLLGLTPSTSLDVEELVRLSRTLPPAWFARVLVVWTGVDQSFCLALLDDKVAAAVRPELPRLANLPPKLAEAFRAETHALVHAQEAA